MTLGWIAYGVGFLAATGLVVRWVSSARTDPDGYIELTSFHIQGEAEKARNALKEAGIAAELDGFGWKGRGGLLRLLVPKDRVQESLILLRREMERARHVAPPA